MPTLAKVLRELKVEDALLYLDQVKMAFGDKPEIYNKFLDIMKNFKAQEIDTPGVIQQVSRLFCGNNKLILGFNTFLPDGYKIALPLEGGDATMTVTTPSGVLASVSGSVVPRPNPELRNRNVGGGNSKLGEAKPVPRKRTVPLISYELYHQAIVRPDTAGAPLEFDHAITYVTTIKKRFAHEPEIYKAFLEILHTYQKEQRSIKDVLEQVSQLFADHSDLLREFTYFLPDAVQEQAKERLSRAARESELRRSRQKVPDYGSPQHNHPGIDRSGAGSTNSALIGRSRRTSISLKGMSKMSIDSTSSYRHNLPKYSRVGPGKHVACAPVDSSEQTSQGLASMPGTEKFIIERHFFERIKESFALAAGAVVLAQNGWSKFLKCIDLYSQDLLQRSDMALLVAKLFSSCGLSIEAVDSFNMMLQDEGSSLFQRSIDKNARSNNYTLFKSYGEKWRDSRWGTSAALQDMDLSCCKTGTPSYRALPTSMSRQKRGEQKGPKLAVLNDIWASKPVGFEGNQSFPCAWKNKPKEELIICEDEYHELDLMINANAAVITVLVNLMSHMEQQGHDSGDHSLRMIKTADFVILSSSHLNTLLLMYGVHSTELIELLYKQPQSTIPTILKRLKQKGADWINIRKAFVKQCKEQLGRILFCAMDDEARNFHQNDRVKMLPRYLLQDLFELNHSQIEFSKLQETSGTCRPSILSKATGTQDDITMENIAQSRVFLELGPPCIHCHLFHLIYTAIERSSTSQGNKLLIAKFWQHFFAHFLRLPNEVTRATNDLYRLTHAKSGMAAQSLKTEYTTSDFKMGPAAIMDSEHTAQSGLIICTQEIYTFFRLYHLLSQRFEFVYRLCGDCQKGTHCARPTRFEASISMVHSFVSGSIGIDRYKEGCRLLLGATSFVLSTVDKLIVLILKQLERVVNDEPSRRLLDLWHEREKQKYLSPADLALHMQNSGQFPSLISYEVYARIAIQCVGNVPAPLFAVEHHTHNRPASSHDGHTEHSFSMRQI